MKVHKGTDGEKNLVHIGQGSQSVLNLQVLPMSFMNLSLPKIKKRYFLPLFVSITVVGMKSTLFPIDIVLIFSYGIHKFLYSFAIVAF